MTKKEFLHLGDIPDDIKYRERRIKKLEAMLSDGPAAVSDTVQSSTDAGDATILCHATVRGVDKSYFDKINDLNSLRNDLENLNQKYKAQYTEAIRKIETAKDAKIRKALHLVCIEGYTYEEASRKLNWNGEGDSVRMAISRWVEENF